MSWSREQLSVLIEEYKNNPCLYAIKLAQYKNKHAQQDAWTTICSTVKEIRPTTTIPEIKNKVNALRTNFMTEFRKMQKSKSSSAEGDEIYKPTLWYFDSMTFVLDHNVPRQARDSISEVVLSTESQSADVEAEVYSENELLSPTWSECTYTSIETGDFVLAEPGSSTSRHEMEDQQEHPLTPKAPGHVSKKKKISGSHNQEELLNTASKAMDKIAEALKTQPQVQTKDSIDVFADFVVSRLRMLGEEELQNEAMERITELLFQLYRKKTK